jgi:beta-glucosidase
VESISQINQKIVVILAGGAPIELPWYDKVKGIIHTYLSGQAGASALVDILLGKVNPSGKLTETYPLKLSDNPSFDNFPGNPLTVEYRESIYVGYRYYDKAKKEVRFPFGFGLSYTTFEYSKLKLHKSQIKENETLKITFNLKNKGSVAGAEVAQLYVSDIAATIFRPLKELKGFSKVFLQPNEEKTITINLEMRAFAFYNTKVHNWFIESGDFEISVGSSSADIKLRSIVSVKVRSKQMSIINYQQAAPIYYKGDPTKGSFKIFEVLIDKPLPPINRNLKGSLTILNKLENTSQTEWGAKFCSLIQQSIPILNLRYHTEIVEIYVYKFLLCYFLCLT